MTPSPRLSWWFTKTFSTRRTAASRWAATPCRQPSPSNTSDLSKRARQTGAASPISTDYSTAVDDGPAQRIAWAVASGRAYGPPRGLEVLDGVRNSETSYRYHAARADLLEAAGQRAEARRAYIRAATLAPGDTERAAFNDKQQALVDRTAPP